jgi:hypothetical protein
MLSIEANESMVYIGISNRGLEKVNGKKLLLSLDFKTDTKIDIREK